MQNRRDQPLAPHHRGTVLGPRHSRLEAGSGLARRRLMPYSRRLLYDAVWDNHRYVYAASMLPPETQEKHEVCWRGRIQPIGENQVVVELTTDADSLRPGTRVILVEYSYHFGPRVHGTIFARNGRLVSIKLEHSSWGPSTPGVTSSRIYLSSESASSIYRSSLDFLSA